MVLAIPGKSLQLWHCWYGGCVVPLMSVASVIDGDLDFFHWFVDP